uniref:Uncharacterized protein n=4 Tax=Cedrus TaxID=3321 RepID=A7YLJ8_CEDAT|nr:hypothetical protein [Cedrus brevifolia]ABL10330.1 hypothetical protein [Cedrus libani]ABL10333.1 hypothetical protein [Cedrus atlantica]ABL10336.1 hypothetical protein [Cedrus deodara]
MLILPRKRNNRVSYLANPRITCRYCMNRSCNESIYYFMIQE